MENIFGVLFLNVMLVSAPPVRPQAMRRRRCRFGQSGDGGASDGPTGVTSPEQLVVLVTA
jgi:hypothetical protein